MRIILRLSMIIASIFIHIYQTMKKLCFVSMLASAAIVSGCGGGSSDSFLPSNPDIELKVGTYLGTTPTQQQVLSLIAPNGEYWILYSKKDTPAVFEGFLQGKLTAKLKEIVANDGQNYVFDEGVSIALLRGDYTANSAKISSYKNNLDKTNTFDLKYDAKANQPRPTVASISGDYTSVLHTTKGTLANTRVPITLKVSMLGVIVGVTNNNCVVAGQIKQDATAGNYFSSNLQFQGTDCGLLNNKTFSGPSLFDTDEKTIIFPSTSANHTQGILVFGKKP